MSLKLCCHWVGGCVPSHLPICFLSRCSRQMKLAWVTDHRWWAGPCWICKLQKLLEVFFQNRGQPEWQKMDIVKHTKGFKLWSFSFSWIVQGLPQIEMVIHWNTQVLKNFFELSRKMTCAVVNKNQKRHCEDNQLPGYQTCHSAWLMRSHQKN